MGVGNHRCSLLGILCSTGHLARLADYGRLSMPKNFQFFCRQNSQHAYTQRCAIIYNWNNKLRAPRKFIWKKILSSAYLCKQKECQAHGGSSPSALIGGGRAEEGGIPGAIGRDTLSIINVGETSKRGDRRCDVTAGRLEPSRLMHLSHRGDVTSRLQAFTTETLTTFGTRLAGKMLFEYETCIFILGS